jgi:hypothetical protein
MKIIISTIRMSECTVFKNVLLLSILLKNISVFKFFFNFTANLYSILFLKNLFNIESFPGYKFYKRMPDDKNIAMINTGFLYVDFSVHKER